MKNRRGAPQEKHRQPRCLAMEMFASSPPVLANIVNFNPEKSGEKTVFLRWGLSLHSLPYFLSHLLSLFLSHSLAWSNMTVEAPHSAWVAWFLARTSSPAWQCPMWKVEKSQTNATNEFYWQPHIFTTIKVREAPPKLASPLFGIFGPKSGFLGPKKEVHFWSLTMF